MMTKTLGYFLKNKKNLAITGLSTLLLGSGLAYIHTQNQANDYKDQVQAVTSTNKNLKNQIAKLTKDHRQQTGELENLQTSYKTLKQEFETYKKEN